MIHPIKRFTPSTIKAYDHAIGAVFGHWVDSGIDIVLPPSRATFQAALHSLSHLSKTLKRHIVPAFKALGDIFGWSSAKWHSDDDARVRKSVTARAERGTIESHAPTFSELDFDKACQRSWNRVQDRVAWLNALNDDSHPSRQPCIAMRVVRDHAIAVVALQCLARSIDIANAIVVAGTNVKPDTKSLLLYFVESKQGASSRSVVDLNHDAPDHLSVAAALSVWLGLRNKYKGVVARSIPVAGNPRPGERLFVTWDAERLVKPRPLPVLVAARAMANWLTEFMPPVNPHGNSEKSQWSSHSFRQSGAHILHGKGVNINEIAAAGRWATAEAVRPYLSSVHHARPLSGRKARRSIPGEDDEYIPPGIDDTIPPPRQRRQRHI